MQLRGGVKEKFQKENSDSDMKILLGFFTLPTNTTKWCVLVTPVMMDKFLLKTQTH